MKDIEDARRFTGANMKITKIGEFMAVMPCHLLTSKMLLLSNVLDITNVISDIAGISMSTKGFFMNEEKRENMESFLSNLVHYDK